MNSTSTVDSRTNAAQLTPKPVSPAPPRDAVHRLEALLSLSNLPVPAKWSLTIVPRLALPGTFDVESINAILGELDAAITTEQVKTGTEAIRLSDAERAELAKKVKEQLRIALEKAEEAKKAASEGNVAGWCTAIFGLIGAAVGVVAACAATGGALAPLAVVGLILAVQEVVNMSLKEADVEWTDARGNTKKLDIGMGGLVSMAVDEAVAGSDMTAEEIADLKKGLTIGLTVAIALTMMVGGGVGLSKVGEAGAKLSSTAATVERASLGTGIVMDVGQAASSIAHAVISVEVAGLERDSDRARAQKAFYETLIQDIAKRMGLAQDVIRELVARFNENYDRMSSTIAAMSSTSATMARNMG